MNVLPSTHDRSGGAAGEVPGRAGQAPAGRRQRPVRRADRPVRPLPRRSVRRADAPRAAVRRGHRRIHRRRVRRTGHRRPTEAGRDRRRPDHREGRRRRRHVVLEPLPRRPVRHGGVRVPPAARGDGAHADREVHPRPRDPRPLAAHRRALRSVRQRLPVDRGHRTRVGRRGPTLDHPDEPGRRDAGAVRGHGNRAAAPSETAGHSRHRDLPGPQLPHQPLGLRLHRRRSVRRPARSARRPARRDHRHGRHRGAVHPAPRPSVR